jgi:ADP-ribosylglycohydrolase
MIGAIIGDIVGSRFEFHNHKSKKFDLFTEKCFVTDDSVMTLAVAKAIMEAENARDSSLSECEYDDDFYDLLKNLAVKTMQEIGRKYPHCGFGGMFRGWVFSPNPEPYKSFGNGAAMRVSPAGFAARDYREAIGLAKAVTEVTHNHEEGLKGAESTAVAIFMARHGFTKDEIRRKIHDEYYPLDFCIDDIRDSYRFDETCQGTVPQAIEAFLESSSFEDAIRTAISVGGDSDTLAAITGGIAEAYYGVPENISARALEYLDDDLRGIYDEWTAFMAGEDANAQPLGAGRPVRRPHEGAACAANESANAQTFGGGRPVRRLHASPTPPSRARFEDLTQYIKDIVRIDSFAECTANDSGDDTSEHSSAMLHKCYVDLLASFERTFYSFVGAHPEYGVALNSYNGISGKDNIGEADVDSLSAQAILAFIMYVFCTDRFSDNALTSFQGGFMLRWLRRLKSIDDEETLRWSKRNDAC